MNGLTLAYIGDAYYELRIRNYLVGKGFTNVNELHKKAIKYTSGVAQSKIIKTLISEDLVTENEISYFKKGRNFSGSSRKNISPEDYHNATGFESLIGYLYLNDIKRCDELIELSVSIIER